MRDLYMAQLNGINNDVIDMGLVLGNAIENSILCLKDNNGKQVKAAREIELDIDKMEKNIESQCLNVILQQQPVASDFHFVSAALKMITDMERIGDITDDIASLSVMIKVCRGSKVLEDIIEMGKISIEMLKGSIDAYVNRDVKAALNVCKTDDRVDDYFNKVKDQLINMIKADAKGAEEAPDALMIAKYFERLGDHCVNLAEWVIYAFTGKHKDHLDSLEDIDEAIRDIL